MAVKYNSGQQKKAVLKPEQRAVLPYIITDDNQPIVPGALISVLGEQQGLVVGESTGIISENGKITSNVKFNGNVKVGNIIQPTSVAVISGGVLELDMNISDCIEFIHDEDITINIIPPTGVAPLEKILLLLYRVKDSSATERAIDFENSTGIFTNAPTTDNLTQEADGIDTLSFVSFDQGATWNVSLEANMKVT